MEQIQLVKEIRTTDLFYESQGSVYFDVAKYNKKYHYGKLSGRNLTICSIPPVSSRQGRKAQSRDLLLEACPTRTYHALAQPVEQWISGWHCECTAGA